MRYSEGGYYKAHWDFFSPELGGNKVMLEKGGQRFITVLIYLNNLDSMGGETYFPQMDLKISPKEGMALIWYNVDENGNVDKTTYHEAMPVRAGEKWIVTTWLRERRYQFPKPP